jgi:hypothetical protein
MPAPCLIRVHCCGANQPLGGPGGDPFRAIGGASQIVGLQDLLAVPDGTLSNNPKASASRQH